MYKKDYKIGYLKSADEVYLESMPRFIKRLMSTETISIDIDSSEFHFLHVYKYKNKHYINNFDGGYLGGAHLEKVDELFSKLKKLCEKIPIKGIFATRLPVRPNPICKTTVKLIERKRNTLIVERLDAIDNTPVIDIKPHLPFYDSPINVKLADWIYDLMDELKKLAESSDKSKSSSPYSINIRSHPCLNPEQQNK